MHSIESYKSLGIITVTILTGGLAFLLWRWPQGRHMTFSQHAAQHRSAAIYYFLVFTLVLPLLVIFFMNWFAPMFHLSPMFTIFIIIASLFQYSVTIIPEVGGWKTLYHLIGSAISGISMLFALVTVLFANQISNIGKVVTLTSILFMVILLSIGIKNKIKHPNLLVMQGGYYAAFFMAVWP